MRRVLVVDDNAVTTKLVRFSLESEGLEVREAATGEGAIAAAREQAPDLVLQDLVLPDVDGFELIERIRAVVGPQIPILAFSGLLTKANDARLSASSFDDFISKPVEPSRLREIVRGYFPVADASDDAFGAQRRLLLADDDPVQRKLAAYRLSRLGFEVIPAADGDEALELARARRPDVIVSDVLMPRMDGFELCARVREDIEIAATPVVLLTNSYLEESDFELARRVGADGYLVRTPELTELAEMLRSTLGGPRRRTSKPRAIEPDVQQERTARALRQLDRQVALNAALTHRNAMLSAELAILRGLTAALAEDGDADAALDTALSACFDASEISWGILLGRDEAEGWSRRVIGLAPGADERATAELERLAEEVRAGSAPREPRRVSIHALRDEVEGAADALLTPIVHRDQVLGVLVLGATREDDEHRAFAGVVAGQIALVLALGRSFRALERASAAERARARVLESFLDSIDDSILVFDHDYQVIHSNRASAVLGVEQRGPDPREWPRSLALYGPDQRTHVAWDRIPVIRALGGEDTEPVELVMIRPGERPTWISSHARPIRAEHGHIEGVVSVTRDVTREKVAQTHQILHDRMASIGVLAAGITHEINNPMSAVIGELDLALEQSAETALHEGLCSAREAADRVLTIVRDLKTLSRGETDDVAPVDVRRPIQVAVRLATPEPRPRATLALELEPVPLVLANEARLGQVFLNLVVNAAQAMPPGRREGNAITVRTRHARGGALVEVEDTGVGMTAEVRGRLFTPFFTTKPIGLGSGLGLSISQRIVQMAGGTIDVDTTPGVGTTFRVWLPAAGAVARAARADRVLLPNESGRKRVLIVDDDPLTVQLVRRALAHDHDVAFESTPRAALARLEAGEPFDVLLVDVTVCDVPPAAMHARIVELRPDLAASLLYAIPRAASAEVRDFVATHVARSIEKPLDARALLAALGRHSGPHRNGEDR